MADGIFAGLQVIDCASWIAGPAAATILSDFGAEVIKIEPPGAGDPWRASPAGPRQDHGLLVAADGPQQAEPGHRSQAPRGTWRSAPPDRLDRRLHHQLPLAGARAPEDRRRRPARDQPAARLRLDHGLWRGGRGGGPDGLRRDRLLGAHRPDGHGAGHPRDRAGPLHAGHGRPSHRDGPLCGHRDGALPPREDRAGRRRADLAAAERPVGEWLLRAEPAVRRARRAPAAAHPGAQRARQSLSLPRRPLVPDGAAQRAPSAGELPEGDRRGAPRRGSALRHHARRGAPTPGP